MSDMCRCGHHRGDHVVGQCIVIVNDEIHPDEHERDMGECPCDVFDETGSATIGVLLIVAGLLLAFGSEVPIMPWQGGIVLGFLLALVGGAIVTDRA